MSLSERPSWAQHLNDRDFDLAIRGLFTTAAAAAYTGLSEGTIRKAIKSELLAGEKQGKGWRITKRDLNLFARIEEA